jgi:hypothetical protein
MIQSTTTKVKKSIRLTISDEVLTALELVRNTRYPFMKDDEIFKLAFSKLFAGETILSNKHTTVTNIMSKLWSIDSSIGRDWLEQNNMVVTEMNALDLCEMIVSLTQNKTATR